MTKHTHDPRYNSDNGCLLLIVFVHFVKNLLSRVIVVLKDINGLLEHRFEYLFNTPAAKASDRTWSISVTVIIFSPSHSLLFRIPLSESFGTIFFGVFNLLSHDIDLCTLYHLPMDSHVANLLLPLRQLSALLIGFLPRIQIFLISFRRHKLKPTTCLIQRFNGRISRLVLDIANLNFWKLIHSLDLLVWEDELAKVYLGVCELIRRARPVGWVLKFRVMAGWWLSESRLVNAFFFPLFGVRVFCYLLSILFMSLWSFNPLKHLNNSLQLDAVVLRNIESLIRNQLLRRAPARGMDQSIIVYILYIVNLNLCYVVSSLLNYLEHLDLLSFIHPYHRQC